MDLNTAAQKFREAVTEHENAANAAEVAEEVMLATGKILDAARVALCRTALEVTGDL